MPCHARGPPSGVTLPRSGSGPAPVRLAGAVRLSRSFAGRGRSPCGGGSPASSSLAPAASWNAQRSNQRDVLPLERPAFQPEVPSLVGPPSVPAGGSSRRLERPAFHGGQALGPTAAPDREHGALDRPAFQS